MISQTETRTRGRQVDCRTLQTPPKAHSRHSTLVPWSLPPGRGAPNLPRYWRSYFPGQPSKEAPKRKVPPEFQSHISEWRKKEQKSPSSPTLPFHPWLELPATRLATFCHKPLTLQDSFNKTRGHEKCTHAWHVKTHHCTSTTLDGDQKPIKGADKISPVIIDSKELLDSFPRENGDGGRGLL